MDSGTRSRRTLRWVALAVLGVVAAGAAIWYAVPSAGGQGDGAARLGRAERTRRCRAPPDARRRLARAPRHARHLPVRAWHGDARERRRGQEPRRRPADESRLRGGPDGEGGRPPRPDRSPALRGAAHARQRTTGARPGAAREREGRPHALSHAARAGFDFPPAGRHPGVAGAPVRGRGAGRPGQHRQREAAAHVHASDRPDRRARRPAPGGSGQHRARRRRQRHRGDHAAVADRRGVPHSRRCAAARDEAPEGRRSHSRRGLRPRPEGKARQRQAADRGQPDRHRDGHDQAQGRIPQRRRRALRQPVRQRADARRDPTQRDARADGGHPARRRGNVRLRGEGRPDGMRSRRWSSARRKARPPRSTAASRPARWSSSTARTGCAKERRWKSSLAMPPSRRRPRPGGAESAATRRPASVLREGAPRVPRMAPERSRPRLRDESVASVHPPAGGDLVADGRDPAGGHRRVSRAAAVGAAEVRLSDDPGRDAVPRREPRRHHVVDHRAAGTPVRADARA